jgi:hypothetical protein
MATRDSTCLEPLATEVHCALDRLDGVLRAIIQAHQFDLEKLEMEKALFGLELLLQDAKTRFTRFHEAVPPDQARGR